AGLSGAGYLGVFCHACARRGVGGLVRAVARGQPLDRVPTSLAEPGADLGDRAGIAAAADLVSALSPGAPSSYPGPGARSRTGRTETANAGSIPVGDYGYTLLARGGGQS